MVGTIAVFAFHRPVMWRDYDDKRRRDNDDQRSNPEEQELSAVL